MVVACGFLPFQAACVVLLMGALPPPEAMGLGFQLLSGRWARCILSQDEAGGLGGSLGLLIGEKMDVYQWES